jgi:hypothetical protein
LIERAYTQGPPAGLAVWCADEAGPFQTVPQPGGHWAPTGKPVRHPHEYMRGGTMKILTLFHPATGQVRIQPARHSPNTVLHAWLKAELLAILAMPPLATPLLDPAATRALWRTWQHELTVRFTLPESLPPLRLLLVWDNLAGHKTAELVVWLCRHGIMPLYTPPGGSWLNMAESIQRILKRRALGGQHPQTRNRSASGSSRPRTLGTGTPRRSPGMANGGSADALDPATAAIGWADRRPIRTVRCRAEKP